MRDEVSKASGTTTDFGFRRVATDDKQGLVRGVFDSVAERYDVMNDVMSAGLHRLWKDRMVTRLYLPKRAPRVLHHVDLAGGTGDIAFRAAARAHTLGSQLAVKVVDINEAMLRVGAARATRQTGTFDFITASVEALPMADASVDFVTIAFGIRNVTHRAQSLAECHRVLRPGGRFVCLEFSHLPSQPAQRLYDAYSFTVIPRFGAAIAGDAASYQYLVESIRKFPSAENFAEEVRVAGFQRVTFERLTGGIAALHSGWRV